MARISCLAFWTKTKLTQTSVLKSIKELASNYSDAEVIWLYGSRASGEYTDNSDYDIAIAFKNFALSPIDKFLRPNELAIKWVVQLGLTEDKLSIVDLNSAPIYLAFNVVEYGKIIYHTDSQRAYREQNRIYSQYEHQMIENSRDE